MSIRCPVCSHPDSLAVNPAEALPACGEIGCGLTAAIKWGLSLFFRQHNRGSAPFLGHILMHDFRGSHGPSATALPPAS